ncbi:MAG: hypothetical protein HOV81_06240 [Kofleriaceae bacterium]|nr:hypothetical protein [Kofleriaceae bacterium]
MKLVAALAIVLSACGGGTGGECKVDGDCGDGVCARNGECLPESAVRSSRVTWTIRGMPANATTCAGSPNFYILFYASPGDTFGFEPVPCAAGVFSIDKLPKRFVSVEIGIEGRFEDDKAFDSQGNASFDLYP